MVAAFKDVYTYLMDKQLAPKLHVLDNECSKAVQTYVKRRNTIIQLVEPHNHQVNAAETSVKAAKYPLLAALATVNPQCPTQLWDKFLPRVELSLNLFHT